MELTLAPFEHLLGNMQLRILTASRAQLSSSWRVPEHPLPCNKIYCVLNGEGGYTLDARKYPLKTGDLAILPANRRSEAWHDKSRPFEKIWIHFDARVLGLVDLFDVIPCPSPLRLAEGHPIREWLQEMVQESRRTPPQPFQALALNGRLSMVLSQVLRESAERMPGRAQVLRGPGDRIGRILQHMAEHYAEPLSLESLAEVARLHPTYFSNTFRKATGTAPMAFLQRFRIDRAKELLASTDLPVMEVAARVGFQDPYHFSRVFKKFCGVAPKEFHHSVRRASPA